MLTETQQHYLCESLNLHMQRGKRLSGFKQTLITTVAFFAGLSVAFALFKAFIPLLVTIPAFLIVLILYFVVLHNTKNEIADSLKSFKEEIGVFK